MDFLKDRDFFIGFPTGLLMHTIMLITRVLKGGIGNLFSLTCKDQCGDILIFDIPISIFYYAFDDSMIVIFSLLLGSILWGFAFYGILKLVKYFVYR